MNVNFHSKGDVQLAQLKNISMSIEHGERKVYHNDYEPYENRKIEATIETCGEAEVFGQKYYPRNELTYKLPNDLEDRFVELWYEVEKRLNDER